MSNIYRWTRFEEDNNDKPNYCLLFKECNNYTRCDPVWSCYSGDVDCAYENGNAPVVLGGIDDKGCNVTTVEVFMENFKPVCNLIPSIPRDMAYKNRATAAVAAKIYGCGGEGTKDKIPTNKCMVLNVLNKPVYEWKSSPDDIPVMPDARTSAAAIGAYGELYVFGGSNVTSPNVFLMSSVSVYNPEKKRWRYLDSTMKHARAGHCAVIQKDMVYLIGGKTCESSQYMSVDTYNITSKTWMTHSLKNNNVEQRMGHACSVYHDKIIISGGSCGTDWTHVLNSVMAIDLTPGSSYMNVTHLSSMINRRMSHGMTIYKDSPYVIGGHGVSDENIDVNEMLDYNQNGWTVNGELHAARSHFSITEIDSKLLPENNAEECV